MAVKTASEFRKQGMFVKILKINPVPNGFGTAGAQYYLYVRAKVSKSQPSWYNKPDSK
jgi:hypothetical protein